MTKDDKLHCATDALASIFKIGAATHVLLPPIFVIIHPTHAPSEDRTFLGFLYGTYLLILGISMFLKVIVECIYEKCNIGKLERVRNDLLIGFGGISMFCGVAPKVMVYFAQDEFALIFWFIIPVVTAAILYFVFIYHENCQWELDVKRHFMFFTALTCFHLLATWIIFRIVYTNKQYSSTVCTTYALTSLLFATSFVDFLAVLMGGLKLKMTEDSNDLTPRKSDQCEVCSLGFGEFRVPRILISCGHSVCELCVANLLTQGGGDQVVCPFCREVTKGVQEASQLPKNHTVLKMLNDAKRNF